MSIFTDYDWPLLCCGALVLWGVWLLAGREFATQFRELCFGIEWRDIHHSRFRPLFGQFFDQAMIKRASRVYALQSIFTVLIYSGGIVLAVELATLESMSLFNTRITNWLAHYAAAAHLLVLTAVSMALYGRDLGVPQVQDWEEVFEDRGGRREVSALQLLKLMVKSRDHRLSRAMRQIFKVPGSSGGMELSARSILSGKCSSYYMRLWRSGELEAQDVLRLCEDHAGKDIDFEGLGDAAADLADRSSTVPDIDERQIQKRVYSKLMQVIETHGLSAVMNALQRPVDRADSLPMEARIELASPNGRGRRSWGRTFNVRRDDVVASGLRSVGARFDDDHGFQLHEQVEIRSLGQEPVDPPIHGVVAAVRAIEPRASSADSREIAVRVNDPYVQDLDRRVRELRGAAGI